MNYLQAENLTKSYGDLVLFDNISLSIHKDQKVALIAKNGAGKTSLLNILGGKDTAESGQVVLRKGVTIGYLEQNPLVDDEKTVIEEVFASSNEVMAVIKEYEEIINKDDKEKLQDILEKMDYLKAWDHEVRVKQILSMLKIENYDQPIRQLSGGQKKRIAMANVLINEPDLLIMDEPTNHLDFEMIEWLEEYLKKTKSTLLMVTHDRYFLDRVCNEILELDDDTIYLYKGNYSYFLEKREERLQIQGAEISKAKGQLKGELEWMRRMPRARGTKAKYRVDAFHDLKHKASQGRVEQSMDINIQSARLGKKILEFKDLNKSFDDKKILSDFSYVFQRNDKLGIVGKNGSGKSTFLNIITNNISADSGSIEVGETVNYGYYKQEGITVNENEKVIDVIKDIAEVITLGNGNVLTASQFLTYFLFPSKMQHTQVSKLSGGEKRRLYLMTVLMTNPNFLILDEPTNDLDILTLNVLEDYLQKFSGCLIIVSHDRYFMDKVVDHLFVFEGDGVIKDFPGNYTIYRDYQLEKEKKKKDEQKVAKKETPKLVQDKPKKLSYKEKREFEQLSQEIEQFEAEKVQLEEEISSGGVSSDDLIQKSNRIAEVIDLLDEKELRWLELSELEG